MNEVQEGIRPTSVETNPVFQLLRQLVENPPQQLHFRNQFHALDAEDCPFQAGMTFVMGQLRLLREAEKAARKEAQGE